MRRRSEDNGTQLNAIYLPKFSSSQSCEGGSHPIAFTPNGVTLHSAGSRSARWGNDCQEMSTPKGLDKTVGGDYLTPSG